MNVCDRMRTELAELLPVGGGSPSPRAADVLDHVRSCEACGRELRALREAWESLPPLSEATPPPEVRSAILARARAAAAQPRGVGVEVRESVRPFAVPILLGSVATALIVAAMSLRGLLVTEGAVAAAVPSLLLGALLALLALAIRRTPGRRLARSVLVASAAAFGGYVALSLAFPIPETVEFCRVTVLAGADVSHGSLCLLYLGAAVLYAGVPAGVATYLWADRRWGWRSVLVEAAVFVLLALPVLGLHLGLRDALLTVSVLAGLWFGAASGSALGGWARRRGPRRVAAFSLAALLLAPSAAAGQAMPFHTPTALPLPLSESAVRGFYQHVEMGSLLEDGEEVPNPQELRVGVDAVPVMVPYGLGPGTFVLVGIPFVHKRFEDGVEGRSNAGPGDLLLAVKRELLGRDFLRGNRRLALFAYATLPTGETESAGEPLPVPLRLGLGTADLRGQAVYSYVNDRFGYHGALSYAAAVGREAGVRAGDRFGYDLAAGYRLLPAAYQSMRDVTVAAYLELNGSVAQPAGGEEGLLPDTGGHTLYLSPGLQLIPRPNWAVEASFQLPVVRELRGTQLGPDWTVAVGARTLLFPFGR